MSKAEEIKINLKAYASSEKADLLQRFFKTKKGEYGEGDIFLGVVVPHTRLVAKKYVDVLLSDIKELLYSKIHEERLCALLILVEKYNKADEKNKKVIADFYSKNLKQANNWDLVDLSAPKILGEYLMDKPRDILYKLVKSKNLWEKRVSVLSCFAFIKRGEFEDALKISEILLTDPHDLIQKAVGWMLREVGKRSLSTEEIFLKKYYKNMPRTMLRYSIEKFPAGKKAFYMKK